MFFIMPCLCFYWMMNIVTIKSLKETRKLKVIGKPRKNTLPVTSTDKIIKLKNKI
jgi:hypothetical protein